MSVGADSPCILVIKHGALGDFILATGPCAAIRRHHEGARIVLLTTAPYADLANAMPYFDEVWVDERPKLTSLPGICRLRHRLSAGGFSQVYDLQTSARSSAYFRLFRKPRPAWSGIARGSSHPHRNPDRDHLHTLDRQREQLRDAGIGAVPPPDVSWLGGTLSEFALPARFALLVPGGALHRPAKRWPVAAYAGLASQLMAQGLGVILIGAAPDRGAIEEIARAAPGVLNLAERTSLGQIAALARRAALAVGNDTGPLHLIAATGCPAVVLFSRESNPDLTAPRGDHVTILAVPDLTALTVERVAAVLEPR
ncbi:MAG: glycosyltransferase family 9 protein [Alphaproteobacteria bacterium]|nr:glycosyltransferase family 9 protein [Alphaproteobacteria bacterium]